MYHLRGTVVAPRRYASDDEIENPTVSSPNPKARAIPRNVRPIFPPPYVDFNPNLPPASFPTLADPVPKSQQHNVPQVNTQHNIHNVNTEASPGEALESEDEVDSSPQTPTIRGQCGESSDNNDNDPSDPANALEVIEISGDENEHGAEVQNTKYMVEETARNLRGATESYELAQALRLPHPSNSTNIDRRPTDLEYAALAAHNAAHSMGPNPTGASQAVVLSSHSLRYAALALRQVGDGLNPTRAGDRNNEALAQEQSGQVPQALSTIELPVQRGRRDTLMISGTMAEATQKLQHIPQEETWTRPPPEGDKLVDVDVNTMVKKISLR
jgi:hypothetical protein